MKYFFVSIILFFSLLLRFSFLGSVPTILSSGLIAPALFSVGTTILVIVWSRKLLGQNRTALLSGFFFSGFPWVIIESRVGSSINVWLFFFLVMLCLVSFISDKYIKLGALLLPFIAMVIYPSFVWVKIDLSKVFTNFLHLNSPTLLGFFNDLFYHGGDREFGILYASLIPLIIFGTVILIQKRKWIILFPYLVGTTLSILNPIFPEVKEFYLALPFFAVVSALALVHTKKYLALGLAAIFIFEFSLFLHDYGVHYPIRVHDYFLNYEAK